MWSSRNPVAGALGRRASRCGDRPDSASPPPGRAQEIARFIEQHYHDRGYLAAAVVPNATERRSRSHAPGVRGHTGTARGDWNRGGGRRAAERAQGLSDQIEAVPSYLISRSRSRTSWRNTCSGYAGNPITSPRSYRARPSTDLTRAISRCRAGWSSGDVAFEGDPLPKEKRSDLCRSPAKHRWTRIYPRCHPAHSRVSQSAGTLEGRRHRFTRRRGRHALSCSRCIADRIPGQRPRCGNSAIVRGA